MPKINNRYYLSSQRFFEQRTAGRAGRESHRERLLADVDFFTGWAEQDSQRLHDAATRLLTCAIVAGWQHGPKRKPGLPLVIDLTWPQKAKKEQENKSFLPKSEISLKINRDR